MHLHQFRSRMIILLSSC